eukprot:comp22258_c0_seq1/m.32893 comp22258_c0_seq1/g.32893  ORF comp22258_c0_seq1/g.32893 comp22258_c0_seq1/m.32893 type:complete len:335 (-) comp22258_c0_seq1:67-1071(-)
MLAISTQATGRNMSKTPFSEGERVLCFHHGLLYESKCMSVEQKGGIVKYLIHYNGWNKSYDEWVDEKRLLKHTPENIDRKRKMAAEANKGKREKKSHKKGASSEKEQENRPGNKRSASDEESSVGPPSQDRSASEAPPVVKKKSHKKQRVDDTPTPSLGEDGLQQLRALLLPRTLKIQLVDDSDFITNQLKIITVPRTPTVADVLRAYVNTCPDHLRSEGQEVVSGLLQLFDSCVGPLLLYRLERWQYRALLDMQPPRRLHDVYGPEHLLRMLVKLPTLLAGVRESNGDPGPVPLDNIILHANGILRYMSDHARELFLLEYETPPLAYLRQSLG